MMSVYQILHHVARTHAQNQEQAVQQRIIIVPEALALAAAHQAPGPIHAAALQ